MKKGANQVGQTGAPNRGAKQGTKQNAKTERQNEPKLTKTNQNVPK